MNRTEFIEKLDALSEEIRLHEPEDIRRVKQRNRPAKKNFGALLFAFLDMEAANPRPVPPDLHGTGRPGRACHTESRCRRRA